MSSGRNKVRAWGWIVLVVIVAFAVACGPLATVEQPTPEEASEDLTDEPPVATLGPTLTPIPTPDLGAILESSAAGIEAGDTQAALDALENAYAVGAIEQAREAWVDAATTLYNAGAYLDAAEVAEAGVAHFPDDDGLLYLSGLAALTLGEDEAAIEHLSALVEVSPEDTRAWRLRGLAYLRQGESDEAIPDLEQAVELGEAAGVAANSVAFEAMADLANALAEEDPQAGLLYVAEKRVLYVNNFGVLPGPLMAAEARIYASTDRPDAALELLGRAIQRNYVDGYYYRAEVWQQIGEVEKAILDLETYLELRQAGMLSAWARELLDTLQLA